VAPEIVNTYLDETSRRDVIEAERARAAIEQHIGKCITIWAHIDYFLLMCIEHWTWRVLGEKYTSRDSRSSARIRALARLLPAEWSEGQMLVAQLREANRYRNALAHGGIAVGGMDGERRLGWHLYYAGVGAPAERMGQRTELHADQMRDRELDARVLQEAVMVLLRDEYVPPEGRPESHPFIQTLGSTGTTWSNRDELTRFRNRVALMFPTNTPHRSGRRDLL